MIWRRSLSSPLRVTLDVFRASGLFKGTASLCNHFGVLLIFDEVMTGFRLARGGAAELYGIQPDLVTYGKVIGGGLPVGAFGGRMDIMQHLAPAGPVWGKNIVSNPIAVASGMATLKHLNTHPEICLHLIELLHLSHRPFGRFLMNT